jgi:hypothetical protein
MLMVGRLSSKVKIALNVRNHQAALVALTHLVVVVLCLSWR